MEIRLNTEGMKEYIADAMDEVLHSFHITPPHEHFYIDCAGLSNEKKIYLCKGKQKLILDDEKVDKIFVMFKED